MSLARADRGLGTRMVLVGRRVLGRSALRFTLVKPGDKDLIDDPNPEIVVDDLTTEDGFTLTAEDGVALTIEETTGVSDMDGPVPVIAYRIVGDRGELVATGHDTPVLSARLKIGTDPAVSQGVQFTQPVTPNAVGTAFHTLPALTKGQIYYYRVAVTVPDGENIDAHATVGRIVMPQPSTANSMTWTFASCHNATTDSAALARAADQDDGLFIHHGDLYYHDADTNAIANFRTRMRAKLVMPSQHRLSARNRWTYTPSDHDGMADGTTFGNDPTAIANWNTAYRELVPAQLPSTAGVYHTYDDGPCRFIILDGRSFKTTTTWLGSAQESWMTATLQSMPSNMLAVIVSETPWLGAALAGSDAWRGFTTERARVGAMIAATKRAVILTQGDSHAFLYEDGNRNTDGGFPVYGASPLENQASFKPDQASYDSTYPTTDDGVTVYRQYGRLVVTRAASSITVQFRGYTSAGTQVFAPPNKVFTLAETTAAVPSAPQNLVVTHKEPAQ